MAGFFGNVSNANPSGRGNGGVPASERAVRADLPALNELKTCYQSVGKAHGISPSVIGAIASRESNGGRALQNGYGDHGKAWGIMQCDIKNSGLDCTSQKANSCGHINMMVKDHLKPTIEQVSRKHPEWNREQQLQGGVAAYNFGVSNVRSWDGLDRGSTQGDYSNDVMARAQYLNRVEKWDK